MKLIEKTNIDIGTLYSELEKQFPKCEMKPKEIFAQIIQNPSYKVYFITNDYNNKCGYFTFLELEDNTILIDYFAINKEYHSQGIGTKTFNEMKKYFSYNGCYLEVEQKSKQDINTIRRANFYEKLGAKLIDIQYTYPNNDGGLPMDLYFMPFSKDYFPDRKNTLKNIKTVFEKLHFDITFAENIYAELK